jgi:hypothetical protein
MYGGYGMWKKYDIYPCTKERNKMILKYKLASVYLP